MKFVKTTVVAVTSVIGVCCIFIFFIVADPKKKRAIEIAYPNIYDSWFQKLDTVTNKVTFILTMDRKIFYYAGRISNSTKIIPELKETSFEKKNGIHDLLETLDSFTVSRMKKLEEEKTTNHLADSTYKIRRAFIQSNWKAKTIVIKGDSFARYNEFIQVIDELKLLGICKFVNIDISEAETKLLREATK